MYIFDKDLGEFNLNLVVARHCSTVLNEQNKYQGIRFDEFLTEKGEAEAKALKQIFDKNNFCFDTVITSDTKRARQTASILAPECNNFLTDKRLRPFDLGDADAKREDELFTICRFPVLAKNKEGMIKYFKRIRTFLRDLIVNHNGENVLIVTHEDISGLIDSYLSNTFILKAPHNGIKNGQARMYELSSKLAIQDDQNSQKGKKTLSTRQVCLRGMTSNIHVKKLTEPEIERGR